MKVKAVLVVDIPDGYGDVYDNKAIVTLKNGKLGTSLGIYNVPLKPVPEYKKPKNPDETWEELHTRWGWNACVDEILGEENESDPCN